MIGDEGGADEVDLTEVRAQPVGKQGGSVALELVEGGHALAGQPDEGPDAEDDEGRIHGSESEQMIEHTDLVMIRVDARAVVAAHRIGPVAADVGGQGRVAVGGSTHIVVLRVHEDVGAALEERGLVLLDVAAPRVEQALLAVPYETRVARGELADPEGRGA